MPNHTSPDVTTFMNSDASNALGAAFFTFVGGCILYGITLSQVYQYCKICPEDSRIYKATVAIVCLADSLHTAFSIQVTWSWLVKDFHIHIAHTKVTWSIKVVGYLHVFMILFVQGVYLSRIYAFARRSVDFGLLASTIIRFLTVVGAILALAAVIVFLVQLQTAKMVLDFASGAKWIVYFAFGVTCIVDIGITIGMCALLYKSKVKIEGVKLVSNVVLSKIIIFFISSGLLTSVVAIVYMALYSAVPNDLLFIGATFSTSKLYANSVLAMLNGRRHLRSEFSRPRDIELCSSTFPSQGSSTMSTIQPSVEEKEHKYCGILDNDPLLR